MNGSRSSRGGRGGRGSGGQRPTITVGGGGALVEVPLYWWVVVIMAFIAFARWAIRWRIELAAALAVLFVISHLAPFVGGTTIAVILLWLGLIAVAMWPAGRSFLVAHLWCVLSRHRVRSALGQAGVSSSEGRLPYVVRVKPSAVGTIVTVWMRSGTALEQLGQDDSVKVGILRAACWAREVRISRHPRWSHLVFLHLVRLDPLAPSVHVASTLPDLLKAARGSQQPSEKGDAVTVPAQPDSPDEPATPYRGVQW